MQAIKYGSSIFEVDTISIEEIEENGYQFKVIFDNNPFSVTRVNEVIRSKSTNGKTYIKVSTMTENRGCNAGKTKTILTVWS